MRNIGVELFTALKLGEIQLENWNDDKLQMVAWIVKSYEGKFLDFRKIVQSHYGSDFNSARKLFDATSVAKTFTDEQLLNVLGVNYKWEDSEIVFFPEVRIIDDVDSNIPPLQMKQEVEIEVIPVKAPLLLPEQAESLVGKLDLSVPKLEEVSQMSQGKKWDSKFSLPRTANERLLAGKALPPVKQLLGEFWGSGELHILFADTGVGKSLLAVDIADHLSRGKQFLGLKNEFGSLKVIYYDFELTDQQFWNRYSNDKGEHYQFSSSMHSDPIDLKQMEGSDICEFIMTKISHDVEQLGVDVVIIDNITYLVMQSTADGEVAIKLMRFLDELKKEMKVSILVLAHTPKVDRMLPLTINSLGGSKHIPNFSDSVSAIGKSRKGENVRYWKQVKCRQFKEVYTENNVLEMEIGKPDKKIEYQRLGTSPESDHLPLAGIAAKKESKEKVLELHAKGKSLREIADETGVSKSTVSRWIEAGK